MKQELCIAGFYNQAKICSNAIEGVRQYHDKNPLTCFQWLCFNSSNNIWDKLNAWTDDERRPLAVRASIQIFNIKQIIVMHQNSFVAVAIDLSLMVANQICRDRAIRSVILGDSFLSSGLAFSSPVQWFLIYIWQQLLEMNKCLLSIQSMCTAWLSTVNFLTRWKFKSLYKVIHTTMMVEH